MSIASFSGSPDQVSPLVISVDWVRDLLTGSVGITLAVLAIAWVGFALLQGRMPMREGVRIVLGSFILFGSPIISTVFLQLVNSGSAMLPAAPAHVTPTPVHVPSKPPVFDPYAGASVPNQ